MVVKAEPGTRERELCEQRVQLDKGGYPREEMRKTRAGKGRHSAHPRTESCFCGRVTAHKCGDPLAVQRALSSVNS